MGSVILIGAGPCSAYGVRGLGGDEMVADLMAAAPAGTWGAFTMGHDRHCSFFGFFSSNFYRDYLRVVPLVRPASYWPQGSICLARGGSWRLIFQTSFPNPTLRLRTIFICAVFAARSDERRILYRGVIPFNCHSSWALIRSC